MRSKYLTTRVWVLIIALILAIMAINPRPWATGIEIKSVEEGSLEVQQGLTTGMKLISINGEEITSLQDFARIKEKLQPAEKLVNVKTDKHDESYNITDDIGFLVDNNLTIVSAESDTKISIGEKVESINGEKFENKDDYDAYLKELIPKNKLSISTSNGNFVYLSASGPKMTVGEAAKTNIKKGLDLSGGTRVLLKPISNGTVTDSQISDLISVMENRLNVYGLADLKIRSASDLNGEKFVLIEIAGATKEEVSNLISKQGVFEAKIGEETVFEGGKGDIPFVCRNDAKCAGIVPPCTKISENQYQCEFQFAIRLSGDAAEKHKEITQDLGVNGSYLEKNLDFYLDGKLVNSLRISSSLKGAAATDIAISGPGFGPDQSGAYTDALKNMKQLQTILITGSLPFKLDIMKLDTISPSLGQAFLKNTWMIAFTAIIAVCLVVYLRYRRLKVMIPIMITVLSEATLTLGIAALMNKFWSIDVAAIAGIIAAIGTGVNDQIIITDEVIQGAQEVLLSWKEKVKRAFGIVLTAFFAIIAAMVPLLFAGAGLIRGFGIATIVGVLVGILITRPAFSSVIEHLIEDEQENKTN